MQEKEKEGGKEEKGERGRREEISLVPRLFFAHGGEKQSGQLPIQFLFCVV